MKEKTPKAGDLRFRVADAYNFALEECVKRVSKDGKPYLDWENRGWFSNLSKACEIAIRSYPKFKEEGTNIIEMLAEGEARIMAALMEVESKIEPQIKRLEELREEFYERAAVRAKKSREKKKDD